jgi:hypothetical protein
MRRNSYFPKDENKQVQWFNNFSKKLKNTYASTFGISNAEADKIVDYAKFFEFLVNYLIATRAYCEGLTSYKNTFKKSPADTALSAVPQLSMTVPATIPSTQGMLTTVSKLIARIKAHEKYKPGIGEDLGIEGSHRDFDKDNYVLKGTAKLMGPALEVRFRKKGVDAMNVYALDEASGKLIFLARQSKSPYRDKRPLAVEGKPEKRSFRLRGVIGDEEIGQLSDTMVIVFGG